MFEVRDVVFGDFLDDVVVGEGFALLEDGALVSAHWILFEVSWVTDKLLLTNQCFILCYCLIQFKLRFGFINFIMIKS